MAAFCCVVPPYYYCCCRTFCDVPYLVRDARQTQALTLVLQIGQETATSIEAAEVEIGDGAHEESACERSGKQQPANKYLGFEQGRVLVHSYVVLAVRASAVAAQHTTHTERWTPPTKLGDCQTRERKGEGRREDDGNERCDTCVRGYFMYVSYPSGRKCKDRFSFNMNLQRSLYFCPEWYVAVSSRHRSQPAFSTAILISRCTCRQC